MDNNPAQWPFQKASAKINLKGFWQLHMRCSDKYPFWFRKISKSLFRKKNLYRFSHCDPKTALVAAAAVSWSQSWIKLCTWWWTVCNERTKGFKIINRLNKKNIITFIYFHIKQGIFQFFFPKIIKVRPTLIPECRV